MMIPLRQVLGRQRPNGVIHAGAHLGEEAEAYQRARIRRVLWIEANVELIPSLAAHVAPYGHEVAHALLAAEPHDALDFNVSNNGQSSSVLALGTHADVYPDITFVDTQTMPARTLDNVCAGRGAIGYEFLNMDLQGYEMECLRGAEQVVEKLKWVYSEVNVDELYVGCALIDEMDDWLGGRGFRRTRTEMAGDAGWGDAIWVRS